MTSWPWPDDPDECRPHADRIGSIIAAAAAELGALPDGDGTYLGDNDIIAKAQAVALDSLGIPYEWVPEYPDYVERTTALARVAPCPVPPNTLRYGLFAQRWILRRALDTCAAEPPSEARTS